MPGFIEDLDDLEVYQAALTVARRAFRLSRAFPKEDGLAVAGQLRRSSSAIGAQIAEAWGKRRYPPHFTLKLSDADAEQLETRHWLTVAVDRGYLNAEEIADLTRLLDRIGRGLNVMMRKAQQFRTG